ncbi:MAG: Holliday junction branch migration protein RuvA [Chloroflexi bacterium]|nr:Holliday junction branch migration protein RuvA [Chloroflexota bacterium]
MIVRVRGRVEEQGEGHIVVDVGPFGVHVQLPASDAATLRVGQSVALFTYLHVREQELSLFGFLSEEELQLFHLLLGASGVGPRLALNVLSTLSPDAIRLAISNDEPGILTRVPGIGAKSARKILFHLKDKFAPEELGPPGATALSDVDAEVIDALTALGYSVVEAQRALQRVPKEVEGVENRLRAALSQLAP